MPRSHKNLISLILCIAALICLLSVSAIAADDDEVVGNQYSVAVSASVTCDAYVGGTIVTHPIAISPSSLVAGDAGIEMYVSKVSVVPKNGWSIKSGPDYDAKKFSISIGEKTVALDPSGSYSASFSKSNSPIIDGGIPVSVNLDFGANSREGDYSDIADIIVLMTADSEVIEIPTQAGELTYTGLEQYPAWSNYNAGKVSTTGTTSATNAGNYTAVFTPKVGYCWSDGSMTPKEAQWSIGKAPCEITTAPTAKSLTYNGSAQELVNAGTCDGGTIQYKLGTGTYSSDIPTETNAGDYTVYYKVDGDSNHEGIEERSVNVTIAKATVSTVPTQNGSLTYNGSSQSPSWNNYDSNKMILGGVTGASYAGTFTVTFTPTANYKWSDGTTTTKNVNWTINKATGSLSLSPTSLSFSDTSAKMIIATRSGDGTVSATSSNTSVATVSVSGTTIYVTPKGNGSATITISVAAGTNHTAPSSKTCSVSVTLSAPIGGEIFYDAGDNGATYTFYDASNNKITYTGINSLANAKTYTVSGTPTKDRFYVIGPQSASGMEWGARGTDVTAWGVSTSETAYNGEANTNAMLSHLASVKDNSGGTNTIWHWLQTQNNAKYGGCNDWFIPSKAELEAMRVSGKNSSLFNNSKVWSASADSDSNTDDNAWGLSYAHWHFYSRASQYDCVCVAVRAF